MHEENPGKHSFKKMLLFQEALADKKTASDYYFLQEKIDSIDKQISEMLKEGPDAFKTEEFKELSKQKAAFRQRKANAEEQATAEAIQQFFPDHIPGKNIFSVAYKGGVKAFSITELIADEGMPEKMRERPWFAGDMELLRSLWEKQSAEITQSGSGNPSGNAEEKRIGMEGGSCLIGSDEMLFVFRLTDGSVRTFDFNTMQELKKGQVLSAQTSTALWEFLESDSAQIESAKVECAKNAITSDEYEALDFLFYLAKKVNAKLVISIPDFSYEKTFMSLFGNLDQRFFFCVL